MLGVTNSFKPLSINWSLQKSSIDLFLPLRCLVNISFKCMRSRLKGMFKRKTLLQSPSKQAGSCIPEPIRLPITTFQFKRSISIMSKAGLPTSFLPSVANRGHWSFLLGLSACLCCLNLG